MTVTARSRRYFLVERYASESGARSVAAAVAGQTGVTRSPMAHRHGGRVAEETCLSLFETSDVRTLAAADEAVGLPADRIVEAEWFPEASEDR